MHGGLLSNAHDFPYRNGARAATKRSKTLAFSDVIVGMARATMECPSRQPDVGSEGVKLFETVRCQMEPTATVLRYFSVIDVYQFFPLGENVT